MTLNGDPKGILEKTKLPDVEFNDLWDRLFIDKEIKDRLVAQVLLEFTLRSKVSSSALPLHGLILLVGPPGTGKTSLAKAVASKAASFLKGQSLTFVEIDPHVLTGSALGKTQRQVNDLLHVTLPEYASQGPIIVLLDEVETLAVDRSKLSMDANPIDVHRATDAVLAGLDHIARKHPQLLFVATSNFPQAIDSAFLSRVDLIEKIGLPDETACEAILADTLTAIGTHWPKVNDLAASKELKNLAKSAVGMDGRQIRKAVLYACAFDKDVALDPNRLSANDLTKAFQTAKAAKI